MRSPSPVRILPFVIAWSAFAIALLSTRSIKYPPRWRSNLRTSSASLTGSPRTRSMTSRALRGEILAFQWIARNSAASSWVFLCLTVAMDHLLGRSRGRRDAGATGATGTDGGREGLLLRVAAEDARHGELAELVAHHVLDDED